MPQLYRAYVDKKLANQALDYDDLLLYWHAMMSDERLAADISGRVRSHSRGRIPGHQRVAGRDPEVAAATATASRLSATTRRRFIRFGPRQSTTFSVFRSNTSGQRRAGGGDHAGRELPFDAGRARRRECADCRRHAAVPQGASDDARGRPSPRYVTVADDQAQAEYVVARVWKRAKRRPTQRQAVLFRSSHHSDALELELTRRNIPFVKYGGLKFLEAAHVKDMLAVLRWADNPKNRIAAFRALQLLPGMGPSTAEQFVARFERVGLFVVAFRDFVRPRPSPRRGHRSPS